MSSFAVLGKGAEGPPGPPGPGLESDDYGVFWLANVGTGHTVPYCMWNVDAQVSHYATAASYPVGPELQSIGGADFAEVPARRLVNMDPPLVEMGRTRPVPILSESTGSVPYTDAVDIRFAMAQQALHVPLGAASASHVSGAYPHYVYEYWQSHSSSFWFTSGVLYAVGYASYYLNGELVATSAAHGDAVLWYPCFCEVRAGPFGGMLTAYNQHGMAENWPLYDTIEYRDGESVRPWNPATDSFDALKFEVTAVHIPNGNWQPLNFSGHEDQESGRCF